MITNIFSSDPHRNSLQFGITWNSLKPLTANERAMKKLISLAVLYLVFSCNVYAQKIPSLLPHELFAGKEIMSDLLDNNSLMKTAATAETDFNVQYMSSIFWCEVRGVKVSGNYAYCILPNGLVIIDISNKNNPVKVSELFMTGRGDDIFVSGNYAYIGSYGKGLQVVNISNPRTPVLVGICELSGSSSGVYVSGNYCYIAAFGDGLRVVNISNPSAPFLTGSYDTPGYASAVYVSSNYAYVADYNNGLQIINVGNPSAPILAGNYDTPGQAQKVEVSGNYAYVADSDSGLQIINISTPTAPTLTGSYAGAYAIRVSVSGNYAYVIDATGAGLRVINISNPAAPSLSGSINRSNSPNSIFVNENYAYVGLSQYGLDIINIDNPSSPAFAGTYSMPGYTLGVNIKGNYAYVRTGRGLQILNISNPISPVLAGSYNTQGVNFGVFIRDNYAYVTDTNGLLILNISNPAAPTLVGSCTLGSAARVYVSGNYAYVAGNPLLRVIDISNPAAPTLIGSCSVSGITSFGFHVSGDYAYLGCLDKGLQIINISNPSAPTLAGGYDTPGLAYGVSVRGNYAYLCDGGGGLKIININNSATPILSSSYAGYYRGVYIDGNYAYLCGIGSPVINISNPLSPTLEGKYTSQGVGYEIYENRNYAYMADSYSLVILRFNPNNLPTLELSSVNDTTCNEGDKIRFDVSATYTGTSSLTYSMASNLPNSANFNTSTKQFSWNPNFNQSGTYSLSFMVTDGVVADTASMTLTIRDVSKSAGWAKPDSVRMTRGSGGTITVKTTGTYTGHSAVIPPNALTEDKLVIVEPPTTSDLPEAQMDSVPSAINFKVQGSDSGYTFNDSVDITIEFKDFEVKNQKGRMRVHYWDRNKQMWKRLLSKHTLDSVNNKLTVKTKHFSVFGVIEISNVTTSSSASTGWNMVSVPVEPEDTADPGALFADNIKPWRIEAANSSIYKYNESTNSWAIPSLIQNGLGYIIYGFESSSLDCQGLAVTGDLTHTLSFTSNNGWHLWGNPYSVAIDWDDRGEVSRGAGISNTYYRWTGTQYEFYPGGGLTRNISPWQGFWVRTTTNNDTLNIRYPGTSKKTKIESLNPQIAWRLQIEAHSGNNQDIHNYVGVSDRASQEFDDNDVYELASLNNEFISLYFPHRDWENNPGNFTQDIRPLLTNDSITWKFEVATNSSEKSANLLWTIQENFDPNLDVVLTVPNGNKIDMRKDTEYKYALVPKSVSKETTNPVLSFKDNPADLMQKLAEDDVTITKFSVTVLKKESAEKTETIPSVYYLNQNYPNPFNPTTTIEYGLPEAADVSLKIYNILGQKIRNLLNTNLKAGVHKVLWDGKDDRGITVASGVYLYKISARNYQQVRKLILIR